MRRRAGRAILGACLSWGLLGLTSGCHPAAPPASEASPSVPGSSSPAVSPPSPATDPVAGPTPTAAEPTLEIRSPLGTRRWTRRELLDHPGLETLTLNQGDAFEGGALRCRAVPIQSLFDGLVPKGDVSIEFDSLDGFSASLDPRLLLSQAPERALAYLAIEDPQSPWPPLRKGGSAGPFYLVWKNPQASDVGPEQWPYQLRSFSIQPPVASRFPGLLPQADLAADHPVRQGYEVFLKNCFACHTLNLEGNARLGPDLNQPHSPVEYMQPEFLRRLIRDPQSLRHWKGSKMSGFSVEQLSDPELDSLLAYLGHMAKLRSQAPTPGSP